MELTVAGGEGWSDWPAPAKLNLFLQITGRRPDGYHDLQTVFRLLDWGDTVHLRINPTGEVARRGGDTIKIAEADDLAIKAANLLRSSAKATKGVDIAISKRIPAGGGFGGGSSDAATVLVALNELWSCGLTGDELARLGRELGADVPVFVRGRSAWAEGTGDVLTPLPLPAAWYVIVDPGVHVPTRILFESSELTRDAPAATIADFVSGSAAGNSFEPVLRRLEPSVDAVLEALATHGRARLTGTGSGCFLEFPSSALAERARAALPVELRAWVAQGVLQSPLHTFLAALRV